MHTLILVKGDQIFIFEPGVTHSRIMKVAVAFFVVCIAVSYAYPNGGQKKTEAKIQGI